MRGAVSQAYRAVAGGWVGSALEYYDFFIYATAASLVFPQVLFPSGNPTTAIVASLATYGVGYVARPVGAFVLGHWGDTHGRKQVLVGCMILMGISTMAVGLLPTYEQAGVLAPAMLVALRLIQGFAVAGEISGSSSLILEHAPFGHRGLYSSFTLQGVQAGQILAAAVFLPLARYMPRDAFMAWGWRLPFLLSVFAVAAGYVVRRRVAETPVFAEQQARGTMARAPIVQAFTNSGEDMLRLMCMAFLIAAQARGLRVQARSDMLFEQIPIYLDYFGFPTTTPEHLRHLAANGSFSCLLRIRLGRVRS